ncbi:MAG: FAD-binding oxidoreductase [Phaeovulum sp.]|uniref:FAD-binding oxidoreductase n=2 Tax=Phaeovulum sp. TaxID=2934796 RepID=UPI0027312A76|nr:FAD-binding oxidoreductase [Phaeovulum sp.]MDP2061716.1 FAD-binding oxidoreductase [Phaeovulum sp.]
MDILAELTATLGAAHVLTGTDAASYGREWTGKYHWQPLAVARPASTAEVAEVVRLAAAAGVAVVPVGGNTGLNGGTSAEGGLMLSLSRMNRIREVNPDARTLVVEAGVVLEYVQAAAAEHGLVFGLSFGAKGSAQVGGFLSTNAGGSNVLRYGSARALCLGLEVVLADGRVLNAMSALHKDNTGYDLRDLFIGAEGTLGIITAAVLRLAPAPRVQVTALLGMDSLSEALALLHRLQAATGGAVEAFEYMPAGYMARLGSIRPDLACPFRPCPVNILVEVASTRFDDAACNAEGESALAVAFEALLAEAISSGALRETALAASGAQRRRLWAMREAAAEITLNRAPLVDTDIALPLDRVAEFLPRMAVRLAALDAGAEEMVVAHLGDGNIHYTAYPSRDDAMLSAAIRGAVAEEAVGMGGSFSAEHGIGLSKIASMAKHKDPVALAAMRAIKAALDPQGILNPGKVLP